jgi:hypothetical protein
MDESREPKNAFGNGLQQFGRREFCASIRRRRYGRWQRSIGTISRRHIRDEQTTPPSDLNGDFFNSAHDRSRGSI